MDSEPSPKASTTYFDRLSVAVLLLLFAGMPTAQPAEETTIAVDDNDLSLSRFNAEGSHLIIWVSPGFGHFERAREVALALSKRGIEVWYIDLAESLFLPQSTNTLRALDGRHVAGLIREAHRQTGKQVTLLTRSYAAIPVLRGARLWQLQASDQAVNPPAYMTGAILFSPELYSAIPPLGMEPLYDPIASSTNIPIMLYQAGRRGNRWQLEQTLERLQSGGAPVRLSLLEGVTGVFYLKDNAAETSAFLKDLPGEIERVVAMLDRIPTPLTASELNVNSGVRPQPGSLDITLRPFSSTIKPVAIELPTIDGERFSRDSFKGRVTLINFWASWCGPCVEEIPALNRLRDKMQHRPFELISINYAEEHQQIREFLNMVRVDFPVLLDADGSFSARWNVLVFPATFVIAMDGEIAYGVNGAIDWDSDDVVRKLEALMKE